MQVERSADNALLPPVRRAEILIDNHFPNETSTQELLYEFLSVGLEILKNNGGRTFNDFNEEFNNRTDNKFSNLSFRCFEISMERFHIFPVEVAGKSHLKIAELLLENQFKEKLSWGKKQLLLSKFLDVGYAILESDRTISLDAYREEFNRKTANRFASLWLQSYEINISRLLEMPGQVREKIENFVKANSYFQFSGGDAFGGLKPILGDDVPDEEIHFIIEKCGGSHISLADPKDAIKISARLQETYQSELDAFIQWYRDFKSSKR